MHQLLRTLIVTGNALLVRKEGKLLVYTPRNYSVLRNQDGTVLDCVLKETMAFASAPKIVR